MSDKPFSPACERNQKPIAEVLHKWLSESRSVFEIGSGTGQHAVYFGECFPHLQWHTSDLKERHAGIRQWLKSAELTNVHPPIELNVDQPSAKVDQYDAVYTANTLHIMSWKSAQNALKLAAGLLQPGGLLVIYGPFKFQGKHTSESNEHFDNHLKTKAPHMGVREFDDIKSVCHQSGLTHADSIAMPANNFILVFAKSK